MSSELFDPLKLQLIKGAVYENKTLGDFLWWCQRQPFGGEIQAKKKPFNY